MAMNSSSSLRPSPFPKSSPVKWKCPFSSGSGAIVTPLSECVKSEREVAISEVDFAAASDGGLKSESLGYESDLSRFSCASAHPNRGIVPKKEETDDDLYGGDPMKAETDDDSSEASRFSAASEIPPGSGSKHSAGADIKEETDDGGVGAGPDDDSSEASRFSDTSELNGFNPMSHNQERDLCGASAESENENLETASASEQRELSTAPEIDPGGDEGSTATVKKEPTFQELERRQARNSRKYGDRVLLARQSMNGMMKLGGGNQGSLLYPKDRRERQARMGGRYAMAYNSLWNFGAPKYAAQPSGHVTMFPEWYCDEEYDPEACPFSVFVMRKVNNSTLGWEYCGEYVLLDDLKGTTAADCVSSTTKKFIVNDIKKSLRRANGLWHGGIERFRERIGAECERDPSPPGPRRLIRFVRGEPEPRDEGKEREDRRYEESREKASNAAKARALGLDDAELSDVEFLEKLVHYDDFYGSYAIKFVHYDESMYDFVKEGATTKNKLNKTRQEDEPCAKASDWYDIMDRQLEENNREVKRKRKRP